MFPQVEMTSMLWRTVDSPQAPVGSVGAVVRDERPGGSMAGGP